MIKALVITVGKGKGVASAIVNSINRNAREFVLFLASRDSWETTGHEIIDKVPELEFVNDVKEISDLGYGKIFAKLVFEDRIEDIEKLILTYYREILRLFSRYKPNEIIADYTSGTKPMSAALSVVAIDLNLAELNYITGKRDSIGRVITGTERGYPLSPTVYNCVKTILKSIDLFNSNLPLAAYKNMSSCYINERYEKLYSLSQFFTELFFAYNLWDAFRHNEAKEKFKVILRNYGDIAKDLGLYRKIQSTIAIWEKVGSKFHPYIALDIFANARRRASLGRWDDAAARLYRIIEYVAQLRLKAFNIETDNFPLDRIKNPEVKEKLKDRPKPIKIALYDSYFVLAKEFNDDIGKKFLHEFNSGIIRKFLDHRNYSILAHGLNPIKESSVEKFFDYVEKEFIKPLIVEKDFKSLMNVFLFPQIDRKRALNRVLSYA